MKTIIVLDNGIDNVATMVTQRLLADSKFQVCAAHNLEEVLSILQKEIVPIIVVDAHRTNIDQSIKNLFCRGFSKGTLIILSAEDDFRIQVQRSLEKEHHNNPSLKGLRTISTDDRDFPRTLKREIKLLE